MERTRNWLGWAALAMSALALVLVLVGRSGPSERMLARHEMRAVPAAPAAPQTPPGPLFERGERSERDEPHFMHGRHGGMMMGEMHFDRQHKPWMGIFGLFGLLKAFGQLVALGVLAWLLLKLFNQRRNGPPAATAGGPDIPRTPAGHDPRVE
jgi:predicted lipid-binding transport protein (Tim44 family)